MILIIIFSVIAFCSTFLGGLVAFRYKDHLHHILGLTAGIVLGVVFFDLFPEIIELIEQVGVEPIIPMSIVLGAFLLFHLLEKLLLMHQAKEDHYRNHHHPNVGLGSALALAGHSFLDGVGIGLGFQLSPEAGILVAIAVIGHDFSDGLNTVSLMLVHKNKKPKALLMLLIDSLAPILGAASTLFFHIPTDWLLIYLSFFAGFLIYIAASDILPEAHSHHPSKLTLFLTGVGVLLILAITLVLE